MGPPWAGRVSPITIDARGSEWGPVALPVFKIGRSSLTRGGWVRLPGASANLRAKVVHRSAEREGGPIGQPRESHGSQSKHRKDGRRVGEILEHHVGPGVAQVIHGMAAGGDGNR